MGKIAEKIYKGIGEGYGFNGSKEDAIKVIEKIIDSSLPDKEAVFQWALSKSESFQRNLLVRQCFIDGAEWMRNKIVE